MLFAKTIIALCAATIVMAGSCQQDRFFEFGKGLGRGRMNLMMDGHRCKCRDSKTSDDDWWTKNRCSEIGKEIKWCYGAAENYCETEDQADEFIRLCSLRGHDCYADAC